MALQLFSLNAAMGDSATQDCESTPYAQGCNCLDEGCYGDALRLLEEAVRLEPNDAKSLNALGVCYLHTQQPEQAYEAFRAAIAADSEFPKAYTNLGALCCRCGRYQEATQVLSIWVEKFPQLPQFSAVLLERAWGNYAIGKPAEALEDALKLKDTMPQSPKRIAIEALALGALGRQEEACRVARKLIGMQSKYEYFAHFVLGNALALDREFEEADGEYTMALEFASDEPHAYYNRGRTRLFQSRYREAINDMESALQCRSSFFSFDPRKAQVTRACCLLVLQDTAAAKDAVNEILCNDPEDEDALLLQFLTAQSETDEAVMRTAIEKLLLGTKHREFAQRRANQDQDALSTRRK
ncbi:tetratricopeptide repeat protein [Aeoliella sp. ICT_H6.2]|uniref:Tetratricopeptide repeat protein n=1 Tax=Aeoliella straminimaris TaxID=2954799 RepID=A0A9X2JG54_9BACT|nr:tetratricopeptide repeat protein [Aeoliella straminimaris]MCO6044022.1 tetratricopeptide repeat protein [Aeoliella straminimaris]